jgi:hypothetical protein
MSAQAPTALQQAITAGGVKSVNFFNGRLLTGEDLSTEQDANALARLRLGQAVGSGVAFGLEVAEASRGSTSDRPVVTVEAGVALSPSGRVLDLPSRTDVALTRDPISGSTTSGLVFSDCAPMQPGTYTAGAGVYLLTIGPAEARQGRAPTSGLGNVDATCATAYFVEGVQFRLLRLAFPAADTNDAAHLRNRVAYRMFGADELANLASDPFGSVVADWSLLDDLRESGCLTDDEVPLALLRWTSADGLLFVDRWAVRRRIPRSGASAVWPGFTGGRLVAEGEARFLQFQDQLADILARSTSPTTETAVAHFDRLPAVALIPLATSPALPGFHIVDFFNGVKTRNSIFIEGGILNWLVRASYVFPPIDLSSDELVWIYTVRENVEASAQQYLVVAHGHMPYVGPARFDLGYADFANYLLGPD